MTSRRNTIQKDLVRNAVYISVTVNKTEDLGSHTMFIGEITDMEVLSNVPSVTYDYYQNNIKPKP